MSNTIIIEALDLEASDTFTTEAGDILTATDAPQLDPHSTSRGYRIPCTTADGQAIYWLFTADTEVTIFDPEFRRYDDNDEDWEALGK